MNLRLEQDKEIAKFALKTINDSYEYIQKLFPDCEFDFCRDSCMWVNDSFFHDRELEE